MPVRLKSICYNRKNQNEAYNAATFKNEYYGVEDKKT